MNAFKTFLLGAALALPMAAGANAASVIWDNSPASGAINPFGAGGTPTYGEVFTAPVSGTLTSFSLWLAAGVGSVEGAVGTWNGGSGFATGGGSPTTLYVSGPQASSGAQKFTFTPNLAVVAGQNYVAFLSTFGDAAADPTAGVDMPLSTNFISGVDYFVFNNGGSPYGNASWDYFTGFGNVQFAATFVSSPAPEPAAWTLMLAGFGGLGVVLRGSRRRQAMLAA